MNLILASSLHSLRSPAVILSTVDQQDIKDWSSQIDTSLPAVGRAAAASLGLKNPLFNIQIWNPPQHFSLPFICKSDLQDA